MSSPLKKLRRLGRRESAVAEETTNGAMPTGSDSAILSCRGIDVAYDKVQVLFGVDLDVEEGEIIALLGTNGAGKSTLLKAISGLVRPSAGTIMFDGVDITKADAVATSKMGIIQVPGGKAVFPTLTVAEHFKAGCWLFEAEDGGTKLSFVVLEEDLNWWQNLLESVSATVMAKNMHSMLAAIKSGVESRASSAA